MKLKRNLTFLLVFALILTLFIGVSCTPQKKPAPKNNTGAGDIRMEDRTRDNRTTQDSRIKDNEDSRKAARLAEIITQEIEEVKSATVVFARDRVYVGIDLKANVSSNKAEEVKREIAALVKKQNKDVDTVYVTEDADSYSRLKTIARDIENGRPISGFLNELENIFKRVTPTRG